MLTMIIGGARSGKSRFAQSLCSAAAHVTYIATLRPEDDEMRARVARHRFDRPAGWITLEEPLRIAEALRREAPRSEFILLDCLTVWLSNFCWEFSQSSPDEIERLACRELSGFLTDTLPGQVIIVTNEVGYSLVPTTPVGRLFRDLQGLVNQRVAAAAQRVFQVVAGIPVVIKDTGACP